MLTANPIKTAILCRFVFILIHKKRIRVTAIIIKILTGIFSNERCNINKILSTQHYVLPAFDFLGFLTVSANKPSVSL